MIVLLAHKYISEDADLLLSIMHIVKQYTVITEHHHKVMHFPKNYLLIHNHILVVVSLGHRSMPKDLTILLYTLILNFVVKTQ